MLTQINCVSCLCSVIVYFHCHCSCLCYSWLVAPCLYDLALCGCVVVISSLILLSSERKSFLLVKLRQCKLEPQVVAPSSSWYKVKLMERSFPLSTPPWGQAFKSLGPLRRLKLLSPEGAFKLPSLQSCAVGSKLLKLGSESCASSVCKAGSSQALQAQVRKFSAQALQAVKAQ